MQARGAVLALALIGATQSVGAARYIVKFNRDSVMRQVSFDAQKAQTKARHEDSFLNLSSKRAYQFLNVQATASKALPALSMMEVELKDAQQARILEQHPEVAYVEEEMIFSAPNYAGLNNGNSEITWGLHAVNASTAWEQGARGAGARVVVLDTGIDKNHQDLIHAFVEGRSFIHGLANIIHFQGGQNLLDNFLFQAFNEEQDETNAYDYFDDVGHGTHVAGTIAAGVNGFGVAGVAPEASILAGKVCSRLGCSSLAIINGLNWAIETQAQVVNMSLGGPVPSRSQMEAAEKAEAAGVMVVAASGNSAEVEKNRISFPAAYPTVFSVGAVTPQLERASFSQYGPELDIVAPGTEVDSTVPVGSGRASVVNIFFNGESQRVLSSSFTGSEENEEPIRGTFVNAGFGLDVDFTDKAKFAGKIALIQRGQIPFSEKVQNALTAGVAGVIIYNNTTGLISGSITTDGSNVGIPVAMVEKHVGEAIVSAVEQNYVVEVDIRIEKTDYAGFAGTSMASPHVAGVAALVRAADSTLTPAQVRDLLRSSATPVNRQTQYNEYGAGIVNAGQAISQIAVSNIVLTKK